MNDEINFNDLSAAYDFSFLLISNLIELEKNLSNISILSPTYKHQKSVFTTKTANHIAKLGFIEQSITEYLKNRYYILFDQIYPEIDNPLLLKFDFNNV